MSSLPGSIPVLNDAERERLLELAREALETGLEGRPTETAETASGGLAAPGAAFVTLRRRETGELRGCCGETRARGSLAASVTSMALASALRDPRFPSVQQHEVDKLSIEISVLGPIEPIRPDEIEIGRHGLVIRRGARQGLLLPQVALDHGWDRSTFLATLCHKAGLPDGAWMEPEVELFGFEALSWGEE